ncbi:MAG: hypothetical protein WAU49_21610 [Steroidobacteraceae bacterium]
MAADLFEKRREQMFPKLTPAQLARFAAHCTRRETTAGDVLLNVGERPNSLFIVIAGTIEALTPTSDESSMPGVFAVGDVRAGSVKRIAPAVGEGSITVQFVHRALRDLAVAPPQAIAAA